MVGILFSAFNLPFLLLGFAGLWYAIKTGGLPRLLAIYVLGFFCLHTATAAGFTYRGMISPLLALFAAAALTGCSARRPRLERPVIGTTVPN
jgi:hypothetical protein